jgi:hypothetical protein
VPRRTAVAYLTIWSYCWRISSQLIVDRLRQHWLEIRVGVGLADVRPVQLLLVDRLQPRQELETEQTTERERHRALAVGVYLLAVDLHLGAVVHHALDHGRDLGRGGRLELGVDAGA